ncbi:MAG: electron transport complex subunit RsxC [Candidatus Omnitrophica bacterium]|nr:electron transport complex subunit RsxC [Candidatus Omnitrophota bacterium]
MFFKKTFPGGIHPPTYKNLTQNYPLEEIPSPQKVVLPLIQHSGSPAEPLVKPEEVVSMGQKIASSDKYISAPIHASISGKVSKIDYFNHPILGKSLAIFIEDTGVHPDFIPFTKENPENLSPPELKKIIQEAGIVGLGGAGFPTHVKLSSPKPIDTLILNAAECEPYLTCDERLLQEKPIEVFKGLEIIIKIISPKSVFIGIEDNKKELIKTIEENLHKLGLNKIKTFILKTKYPQGGEKQLIKAITGRIVPSGGLPFDVGTLVHNVGTVFAVYEAVYLGKPLYERIITISGKAIKKRGNFKVKMGTLLSDIVEYCGGFIKEPKKIIFGGPMMGIAQWSLDTPIIKGTSGVLFLTDEELNLENSTACIRCGKCIEVCPMQIMPASIGLAGEYNKWNIAKEYSPLDCIECGACSYICPTRRDLVQFIKLAKQFTR